MRKSLDMHDVKGITIKRYDAKELKGEPVNKYTVMAMHIVGHDGEIVEVTLFGDEHGIAFSAPALEERACAECGNLMPRDYHPRVTVCSACETQGAPLAHVE